MDQQNSDASNRPILKLKPSKNLDVANKVKLQLKSTAKNNKEEQSLKQDTDQSDNTEIKTDTDSSHPSEQMKTPTSSKNNQGNQDNNSIDEANTHEAAKKKYRMEPKLYYKTLKYLCKKYPNCFKKKPDYPIPLAIRIHKQLQVQEEGNLSHTDITKFLSVYTRSAFYKSSLHIGVTRVNLDGSFASIVTEKELEFLGRAKSKLVSTKRLKSDALFKSVLEDKIAATEFLEAYLPDNVKNMLDLSTISIERESYVEDDLKRRLSDIVYSIKYKDDPKEKAFVFCLAEHQSTPDYWIALRLFKYMLLLCERHKKKKDKLPLVVPLVLYNGKTEYTAPKSFWELFYNPDMAKSIISDNYQLIDLQSMSDDEIKSKPHLGMFNFFMKHIHQQNMLELWQQFLTEFTQSILIDKEQGYIYIKKLLWYTSSKVATEKTDELNKLILSHLPDDEGEKIMRTIADSYIDEGLEKGIEKGMVLGLEKGKAEGKAEGIAKGKAEGKAEGIAIGVETIVRRMLQEKTDINFIASVTGLSNDEILKIQNKT